MFNLDNCVEEVESSIDYEKNCSCPLPCWESQYLYTTTSSQWPSNNYEVWQPLAVHTIK